MSIFAAGGSVGFFLAPVLATPALAALGVGATMLFIPPALLIALLLLRDHARRSASRRPVGGARGTRSVGAVRGADRGRSGALGGILRHQYLHRALLALPSARLAPAGAGPRWPASWSAASPARCSADGSRTGSGWCARCSSGTVLAVPMLVGLRLCPASGRPAGFAVADWDRAEHPVRRAGQAGPGLPAQPAGHRSGRDPRARGEHRRPHRPVLRADREHIRAARRADGAVLRPGSALLLGLLLTSPQREG